MSVNYSLALMSSKPGDDTAPKLYYAKAQAAGEVTMDEMTEATPEAAAPTVTRTTTRWAKKTTT